MVYALLITVLKDRRFKNFPWINNILKYLQKIANICEIKSVITHDGHVRRHGKRCIEFHFYRDLNPSDPANLMHNEYLASRNTRHDYYTHD